MILQVFRFERTLVLWLVVLFNSDTRFKTDAARTTASWSTWGRWSSCNRYDTGRETRFRSCVDSNGRTQSSSECVGLARRTRLCKTCVHPLLVLNRKINTASPSYKVLSSPGLHKTASKPTWCGSSQTFSPGKEYLEIAFKNFARFTGVAIRGYITAFELRFSYDGKTWFPYRNRAGKLVFNKGTDTTRLHRFGLKPGFVARYVRVYPTKYQSRPCIDYIELYGCAYTCGGIISNDLVNVSAPNAAEHIEEPNCLWRIESREATKFLFKFSYFKLLCRDGFLKMINGASYFTDGEVFEELCGESRKISPIAYMGNNLWLHYRSNATADDVGFRLRGHSFGIKTLNASSGRITVPETRDDEYSHIFRYTWSITTPDINATIQLTIRDLESDNIRRVNGKCSGDSLIFHSSRDIRNSLLVRLCDDRLPKVVNSTNGYLRIKFRAGSAKPSWKLRFSYKILGTSTTATDPTSPIASTVESRWGRDDTESSGAPSDNPTNTTQSGNDTRLVVDATRGKKSKKKTSSNVPVIISSTLAVVIVVIFVVALVHFLRRRKEFLKKHPYDCSNRPMSHFGDEDSTPFINQNVLLWNDTNSREREKEKPKNGKNALPYVTVALREESPQRLSIIPPEMLAGNSEQSLENCLDGNTVGSLVVSDAFTEECMQLLNNNLSSALHDENNEKTDEMCEEDANNPLDHNDALPDVPASSEARSPDSENT